MHRTIQCLLVSELRDLMSSELQIIRALPKMIKAAECQELKQAFRHHLEETKGQVQRLKKIFRIMKIENGPKFCKATQGLIQECREVLGEFRVKSALRDAAIISKAQRIEHYEISAYGSVRAFAKELGLDEISKLLKETLDEESAADSKLSRIAKNWMSNKGVNHQARVEGDDITDAGLKIKFFKGLRHLHQRKKAA